MSAANPTINDLLVVVETWSSPDDWDVPTIYADTLRELADAILHGDNMVALRDHGQHMQAQCVEAQCATLIPYFLNPSNARMGASFDADPTFRSGDARND